ncbi:MAG: hypothetical protein KAJ51_16445, partial [Thermoplasmata archaeon]|nr:hypothetical protein [Thermoplasmata archaeon]
TVTNCTAFGDATGTSALGDGIGGLLGWNDGGSVNFSIAYGNAIGIFGWLGGLIGCNYGGTTTNSTAFGNAIAFGVNSANIGGLIGYNWGGTAENCYSHGDATGDDSIGGLIGNNSGTVKYCYSIGFVSGNANVSGLIGVDTGTVTDCFWDNITSGHTSSAAGTGKNTTVMQQESTFINAGWNFTGIWAINNGKTYPYFGRWHNPPQITTADVNTATEDTLYSVDYDAALSSYPPDNYIDYWTVTSNGSGWLSIDSNGVLSSTPSNDDLGTYWVNVTVTDIYGGTHSHNFSLTIFNVNTPPYITTPNDPTAVEDILYSVDYDATDPDPTGDIISWNYTTNATWLNFNKLTSVLYGKPSNYDVGTY